MRSSGHAAARGVGLRQTLEGDRDQGGGRETHLFDLHAVTDGRWGAGASMPVRHDHGVAAGFDFRRELGVIIEIRPGFQTVHRLHTGHVLLEPDGDLREEAVRSGEAVGHEENGLAVEGVQTRCHGDQLDRGRHPLGIEGLELFLAVNDWRGLLLFVVRERRSAGENRGRKSDQREQLSSINFHGVS